MGAGGLYRDRHRLVVGPLSRQDGYMVGWVSIGVDDEGLFCARSVFLVLIILAFMSDLPCVTRRGAIFMLDVYIYIFGAPKAGCREGNGLGGRGRYVCV